MGARSPPRGVRIMLPNASGFVHIIGELTGGFSWVIDVRHLIMQEVLPIERLLAMRCEAARAAV
ncbi:hypothetical protein NONS58_12870 [Nitrosococcus oceani]|nr:hypothetical protein NONS58_12870 [Nitrosococcus oceani]